MKNAKLFSVLSALILLVACTAGVLIFGTSAADETVRWTVDGTTYSSVKAALTAAEKETWAATQSLVITVDPAKLASESISHDADGNAYAGGIAFGQKTIFRADGTRLPITIKGSSDRAAFTLNITAGAKIACANSYTFEDLTFPIGDAGSSTYFFAGSGIVRLENVATSSGSATEGWIGGDNFTARAFDGWTADKIKANADDDGKILTSIALGNNVSYVSKHNVTSVHSRYLTHHAAVQDSDGWDAFEGVALTPADTKAEIVIDGATVGILRGRVGFNPVAESIMRIENGSVHALYGAGTYNSTSTFSQREIYEGDFTLIINGGTISGGDVSRVLHTAEVRGDYTIRINGGTFPSYFQAGFGECAVTGDFRMDVTGGSFNATGKNCFFAHPSAKVGGTSVVNISGGTFAGYFRGTHGSAYISNDKTQAHESIVINVMPNAKDASKSPVFKDLFFGAIGSAAKSVKVNISGGTFKKAYSVTDTVKVDSAMTTVTGGTFEDYFYGGAYGEGTVGSIVNDVSGGTFKQSFYGGGQKGTVTSVKTIVTAGNFERYFYGGSKATPTSITEIVNEFKGGTYSKAVMGGNLAGEVKKVVNTVSAGIFNSNFYAAGEGGTVNEVNTTITGGTLKGYYFGGLYGNSTTDITNNFKGGTFNKVVMGAGRLKTTGDVTTNITGGTFNSFVLGAGIISEVDGNITNNISGGSFAYPVYGGAFNAAVSGTITNNLSGPVTFTNGFCGVQGVFIGTSSNKTKTTASAGAVVNRVFADANGKAPIFYNAAETSFSYDSVSYSTSDTNGFAFLGGVTYGSVAGTIQNTIEAGEFGTSSIGMFQGGNREGAIGANADGVSILNTVKGGTFHFRFYGGCLSGTASGETRNEILGGKFEKEFVGGNRTMVSYNKLITTIIRGGEFMNNVYGTYLGYTADQCARGHVSSTVTLQIEDGTFRGDIYGLGNAGAATTNYPSGSGITEDGSVLVNVYGGAFYGVISPTNVTPVEASMEGLALVTIEPKCGDIILGGKSAPRFAAEKYALKGASYDIYVNGEGALTATSAEGKINLIQIDKWKSATYLTLPAGHNATVNVSTAPTAYGYYETVPGENGEILEVYGSALKIGASMILTERIALKFQLSKTAVDAVENFTYSFTLPDGTVLAQGDKDDLKDMMEITEFEYYTFVLKSLGINQFDTPITVNIKGIWENGTFTVSTLAESAVSAWEGNDDFVLMAKAIVNMAKAAKGEALPYSLTPDAVSYERKTPSRDEDALFKVSQKSLLMSSAVGLRISGTVASEADAEGLAVKVNGNDVTSLAVIKVEGTDVTVDLYFSAYGMGEEFELQILDKNGKNCLTMLERLDAFANEYGADHPLAYSLLSYIQATSNMAKASFNMAASEEEIAYLNSLYAGETAYYGDLHGHPGGGIIEDGKVDMSVWVADRTTIGVDFYTAMNHKQVAHMYDDGWDDTVLIGGSEPAASITKDGKRISLHYNMIVPNPEALIEVLQLFPEFGYTGGKDGVELNMGQFGYPGFTHERFNELVSAIKERGGTVVNVHPKQQHTSADPLDYYYQDYMGLEVFYSYTDKNIHGKDSQDNYKLWTDLLAMGKRVWATAGSDSHGSPVNTGLTTLYSSEALNTKYVEKIATGNMAPGYAGIRMAIGDTEMGGHTDFEGKKLIFSVGDIHEKYLSETRAYTVNVITDQGVVYSAVIDGTKTTYFSLDADENAKFYRIEVLDEDLKGLPIVGLGNPIWND